MVASDTTLLRNLSGNLKMHEVSAINKEIVLKSTDLLQNPVLGKTAGIVDGT